MRSLPNPLRTVKNLQRMQQVLSVFIKHGFGSLVQQLQLAPTLGLAERIAQLRRPKESAPPSTLTIAERLRIAFEELGPSFVKLGQVLSTRPDLFPADVITEFRKLQEQTSPLPFSAIRTVVEAELGGPISTVYALFEEQPVASASIAQVHFATLQTGQEVVVKVQRPGIERTILSDISLFFYLAEMLERYVPESQNYAPSTLVEEFSRTIQAELDFIQEASNTERFSRLFRGNTSVVAPRIYWEFTTTRVLTEQRLYGFPIDRIDLIDQMGLDRKRLAIDATNIFMSEVLDHGFFHADPHPGNIWILENGAVGVLDFGLVGRVDRELREAIVTIVFAIISKDYERMVRSLISLGIISEQVNQRNLQRDLMNVIEPNYGQPIKYVRVGPIMQDVFQMISKYNAKLPGELLTLVRTLVIVEGIGRTLDPDLDLLSIGTPFLTRLVKDRVNPARLATDAFRFSEDTADLLRALPDHTRMILRKTLRDELALNTKLHGLEPLTYEVDRLGNRLALALIISSLIVGSTMLLGTNTSATWSLGLLGLAVAGVLGLWLAYMIIRQGKY